MATSKGNELMVRLLLQERDKLNEEFTEAQKKWTAEFSQENSMRFMQIVSDIDNVRDQLQVGLQKTSIVRTYANKGSCSVTRTVVILTHLLTSRRSSLRWKSELITLLLRLPSLAT